MNEQSLQKLSRRELAQLMIKRVDELFSMCDMSNRSAYVDQKKKEIDMIQKAIDAVATQTSR